MMGDFLRLMVVGMVAPEAIMGWAMRQWINAYKLGYKYRRVFIVSSYSKFLTDDISLQFSL